jgi:hypothetical protein
MVAAGIAVVVLAVVMARRGRRGVKNA